MENTLTRKGKAHSTRPVSKRQPIWCKYAPEEVEPLVVKLAKEENNPSAIGLLLRDQYGIPLVKSMTGKTIGKILREGGALPDLPEDLSNLIGKVNRLRRHLEKNKGDLYEKRSLALAESKVRRLVKYYGREGVLPKDWKYRAEGSA